MFYLKNVAPLQSFTFHYLVSCWSLRKWWNHNNQNYIYRTCNLEHKKYNTPSHPKCDIRGRWPPCECGVFQPWLCLHFSLKLAYFREKFLTFHLTQMSQYSKAKCCYLRHIPPHKIEGLFHPRERETVQAVHDVFDMHECSYCSALSLGEHCFVWFTYLLILQQYCETVTSIANMWRFKGLLPEPFVPLVFWGPSMRVCMASACIRACGEDPPFNLKCWVASSEWNLTFTHTNRFRHK